LEWLRTFPQKPQVAYLVHAEPAASAQFRDTMTKELGWNVKIAEWLEKVPLN
jgi:metallo-beta-lactamase family protein